MAGPVFWSLRIVPRRAPGFAMAFLVTAASIAAAVATRWLVLGLDHGAGLSVTYFPALIVATLFAGPMWGWLALATAVGLHFLAPGGFAVGPDAAPLLGLFVISGAATVAVAQVLRTALVRLDAAAAARDAAQRSLEASEARFRALADSAPILMWVTRMDGKREFANRAYVDFLGASYEEAIVFDWRDVLHPDDLYRILQEQVAGEASRRQFTLEARYRRWDGAYRWVRSVSQPRWSPDREFAGFVGVGYDVTDAKKAEQDLKRINDLLAERVEAALAERDEAEAALHRAQKLDAVGQLTGGVAHDFNNLLTVIIGALDLIQRHPANATRRARMIEAAHAAALRGERLTRQLLAFSRRQALSPEPLAVDSLLRESEPLLRRAVGEALTLVLEPHAEGAIANVDPSQFEAAIMNLVVNARDATPGGGMIRVESVGVILSGHQVEQLPGGPYVCVSVHDTGAGMDDATMARAFEPFFTTKAPGHGTGLGLSQVYGFARQSGGAVTVESAPGKGASVRLYLPRVPEAAPDRPSARMPAAAAAAESKPLRVLLVEDDLQVAELVDAMLVELGHSVLRAVDADDALGHLNRGERVDLMLTDLIMPGEKSGVDLAREAVALRPRLPVILSSGYTGEVLSAAEEAPWPLLRKPYGADDLARYIADAVGRQNVF